VNAVAHPRLTAVGLGCLGLAWVAFPALGLVGMPPFTLHMSQHMLVVALAAPLLALGLAGGRWDPVPRHRLGMNAIAASMVELVAVWAWHAPALHHFARGSLLGRCVEQLTFLGAGLYLWLAALGGGPAVRRERAAAGVTGLLLTSMHMTLLGALLTLSPRALFHHAAPPNAWLGPVHDQNLGGAIMLVIGAAAYLVGGLWLAARAFGEPAPREVTR